MCVCVCVCVCVCARACVCGLTSYTFCAVAAVHDGYVLRKSVHSSPMGGRLLSQCMQVRIEHCNRPELTPQCTRSCHQQACWPQCKRPSATVSLKFTDVAAPGTSCVKSAAGSCQLYQTH